MNGKKKLGKVVGQVEGYRIRQTIEVAKGIATVTGHAIYAGKTQVVKKNFGNPQDAVKHYREQGATG